jgi:hypothetical protein
MVSRAGVMFRGAARDETLTSKTASIVSSPGAGRNNSGAIWRRAGESRGVSGQGQSG